MQAKRQKRIKHIFDEYNKLINFTEPITCILDGNFIKRAIDVGFDFDSIEKSLKRKVVFKVTECIIKELEKLKNHVGYVY